MSALSIPIHEQLEQKKKKKKIVLCPIQDARILDIGSGPFKAGAAGAVMVEQLPGSTCLSQR
jgi:hypothetical protein